ncbi:phage major capsid protein [Pseudescherichia sp.]|uniref:phage major capsid family protein n=1 Tax=Pseudescherichia sp. TaxID=2055881 RepID=UPI00289D1487|nr:phage major capsid protein [Pseudescherichia sp.]
MKIKNSKRELKIPLQAIDVESQTIDVAFCTEQPVEREINGELYNEVLLCTPENVDLRRLNNSGAVLFNHNRDHLIGACISARMDIDRIGRATLKISSTASDEWEMIKEGVLTHISIGYNINDYRIDGSTIFVTSYEIYEISLVTVPADTQAGIGRSLDPNENPIELKTLNSTSETIQERELMEESENKNEELQEEVQEEVQEQEIPEVEVQEEEKRELSDEELLEIIASRPDLLNKLNADEETINSNEETEEEEAIDVADEERQRELTSIGKVLNIDVSDAIANGISVADFKRQLNENKKPIHDKEIKVMEKNLIKDMVRAIKSGDKSVLENYERGLNGFVRAVVPSTNTTSAAGLVAEDLQDQYIPELLKRSVLGELAPTVYSGLAGRGTLAIPKAQGVAQVFKFYGEGEAVEDSIASFSKVILSPKIFAGAIPVSKTAILTAPNVEAFVQAELIRYAAQGLEQSVFDKITAAAPVQLTATAGALTQADVQGAVAALGSANVDVRGCKAVMNSKMLAKMRQTKVLDNTAAVAMVEGYRADAMWLNDEVQVVVSEFVADDTILIGSFENVIIANWMGQEVDEDSTTHRSSGTIVFRVWDYSDVGIAHAEAFVQLKVKPKA